MIFFKDLYGLVSDEVLKKASRGTVLDVGTGPGYLPIKIALGCEDLEVIGMDISRDMIRMARKNVEGAGLKNVRLLVGDVSQISVSGESVDLAVSTVSFHHWAHPVEALNELFRVLKRGGEVWIYELDGHPTPQSKAWMKRNYSVILRLIIRAVRGHSITAEDAEGILKDSANEFTQFRVEQLEIPLIKITLTKS